MRWALLAASVLALAGSAAAQPEQTGPFRQLRIGQSITLDGGTFSDPGTRMRFTLLAFVDPVRSPSYRPRAGTRFVAFRLRVKNVNSRRWQGTLASWAQLVDTGGGFYDVTSSLYGSLVESWPVLAPVLNGGRTIEPRETVVGYLGWIIPKTMKLKEFRYTLEGGPETAAWTLRR
jgi:hypothetical protein